MRKSRFTEEQIAMALRQAEAVPLAAAMGPLQSRSVLAGRVAGGPWAHGGLASGSDS